MSAQERRLKLFAHDQGLWEEGLRFAGLDEAGRGPLAGSVVAACVVLDPRRPMMPYIDDSKKLSELRREQVYERIMQEAVFVGIGEASAQEIDRYNILEATRLAMCRAAKDAPVQLFYIDALREVGLMGEERPMIKGDALCYAIAAASIVAKVTRDRQMRALEENFPGYGFARHKGYGTAAHYEALRRLGPCPVHRRSFLKGFLGP